MILCNPKFFGHPQEPPTEWLHALEIDGVCRWIDAGIGDVFVRGNALTRWVNRNKVALCFSRWTREDVMAEAARRYQDAGWEVTYGRNSGLQWPIGGWNLTLAPTPRLRLASLHN